MRRGGVLLLFCASTLFVFAADLKVEVRCREPLGEASQIQDFLGAGGGLESFVDQKDHPVLKAWRALGMRHVVFENLEAEDPETRKLVLSRDAGGKIKIDFTDWDRLMKNYLNHLKATPFIYLGNMPRNLSSQPKHEKYATFMPRDLDEWKSFVSQVVRHQVETFGLKGLYYGIPGEPDFAGNWVFDPGDKKELQLKNSVRLAAATCHAVKSVDPTAKVGGPATMSWKLTPMTENENTIFALSDWIKEWARYNASVPAREKVQFDFISWQDYAWAGERISEGADAVSKYLAANGFDPKLPKILGGSGWGSWSSDYLDGGLKDHQRASHLAHNLIREFKDPSQRKFARAYYYFFYSDDGWYPGDSQEDKDKMDEMRRTAPVRLARDGSHRSTPVFAAFEIASALSENGKIIKTLADEPIEVMATLDQEKGRVLVAVNNHRGDSCDAKIVVKDLLLKGETHVRVGLQRIDEEKSSDGKGLEPVQWKNLPTANGTADIKLFLKPYGTVLISILSAG